MLLFGGVCFFCVRPISTLSQIWKQRHVDFYASSVLIPLNTLKRRQQSKEPPRNRRHLHLGVCSTFISQDRFLANQSPRTTTPFRLSRDLTHLQYNNWGNKQTRHGCACKLSSYLYHIMKYICVITTYWTWHWCAIVQGAVATKTQPCSCLGSGLSLNSQQQSLTFKLDHRKSR